MHLKEVGNGGHSTQSQHYAGLAFDVGQNLSESGRNLLRNMASLSGYWRYVEPINLTPRWVHFDNRWVANGYPLTRQGAKGIYVLVAQDALNTLGLKTGGLDGIFGTITNEAVMTFQKNNGLSQDGLIGPITWNSLMTQVVGKGATSTTIIE